MSNGYFYISAPNVHDQSAPTVIVGIHAEIILCEKFTFTGTTQLGRFSQEPLWYEQKGGMPDLFCAVIVYALLIHFVIEPFAVPEFLY